MSRESPDCFRWNKVRGYEKREKMERWKELRGKKILIYGVGKIAAGLIEELSDFKIVGILDRVHFEGTRSKIPILTWDDIHEGTADAIILGALKKNYKTIYDRIQYRCTALGITVYGENGRNLDQEYQLKYMDNVQMEYFEKNEDQLKSLIDEYEAISFDLFDTLIMRKTLEPVDLFDLVQDRIKRKGVAITDFKKKRRTAEIQSRDGDINKIYDNLRMLTGISESDSALIMQEEIECEKECLLPRRAMVEIMNDAIKKGKTVSIISDMYLPASVLEPILKNMEICGYRKLYVSCEYGSAKGSQLFQIYKQEVGCARCLHIGDNPNSDVAAPRKFGIDSYEIKSALELLKMSSLRKLLVCSNGNNNQIALGLILAELLNNPFALYHTSGFVPIRSYTLLAKLFAGPTALVYLQNLARAIQKRPYEGILFSARDGYLFKKLYEMWYEPDCAVPAIYFLTSRKLCLAATLDSDTAISDLSRWFPDPEKLRAFFREVVKEDFPGDLKLKEHSAVMKEHYKTYAKKLSIDWKKTYLFCDLNSSGTAHYALNQIFSTDLDGFYLCRKESYGKRELKVVSVYDEKEGQDFSAVVDLLETIFTSQAPSVSAIDGEGQPVYAQEKRTKQELEMVEEAQNAIMEYIQQYAKLKGLEHMIGSKLPEVILGLFNSVKYEGETAFLSDLKHVDDLSQTRTSILK